VAMDLEKASCWRIGLVVDGELGLESLPAPTWSGSPLHSAWNSITSDIDTQRCTEFRSSAFLLAWEIDLQAREEEYESFTSSLERCYSVVLLWIATPRCEGKSRATARVRSSNIAHGLRIRPGTSVSALSSNSSLPPCFHPASTAATSNFLILIFPSWVSITLRALPLLASC
jgi:hypothetical protein